jgi:hypothetical protein
MCLMLHALGNWILNIFTFLRQLLKIS